LGRDTFARFSTRRVGRPGAGAPGLQRLPRRRAQRLGRDARPARPAGLYLAAQLAAFAKGECHNNLYQQMRSISGLLTPAEAKALAVYYGGMPVPKYRLGAPCPA
jgi:hypothetical protein